MTTAQIEMTQLTFYDYELTPLLDSETCSEPERTVDGDFHGETGEAMGSETVEDHRSMEHR